MIETVWTRDGGGNVRHATMGNTYYRIDASTVVEVREMWYRDLSGDLHPVFLVENRTITSVAGYITTGTTFDLDWTLSGDGAFHTLTITHVPSGIVVDTINDPAASVLGRAVTTVDSTEQHVATLYDRDGNVLDTVTFTPS